MSDNPYQESNHASDLTQVEKGFGNTLVKVVGLLGVAVILFALVLPAIVRDAKPAVRVHQCKQNLRQISLALSNYHAVNDAYPPAYTVDAMGRPLHSWRTLLLPYLDQHHLYKTIDLSKPWNDPANALACETALHVYRCPSVAELPPNYTTYLAPVGPDRCFLPNGSRRIPDIASTSNTLMVFDASSGKKVHWMAPQDDDGQFVMSLTTETELAHTGHTQACLVDGSITFLSDDTPVDERRSLLSITRHEISNGKANTDAAP